MNKNIKDTRFQELATQLRDGKKNLKAFPFGIVRS